MAKLSAKICETAKPLPGRDRLLGDGDGLSLRIRPNATKTWVIEFEVAGLRRKYTIGVYDSRAHRAKVSRLGWSMGGSRLPRRGRLRASGRQIVGSGAIRSPNGKRNWLRNSRRLRRRGALPKVTACHVHDLRRTFITRLPDLGFEPFIGHKVANHVLPGVMAHYNFNEYLPQRKAALEKWADRIETLANGANVVQFQRSVA